MQLHFNHAHIHINTLPNTHFYINTGYLPLSGWKRVRQGWTDVIERDASEGVVMSEEIGVDT